ncbi:MAG: MBL fold metallo-hydrolase [Phycisphaerae bacterium]|nr:MBL fold metallo-hydrolase [Phycisphaerae bacterium]
MTKADADKYFGKLLCKAICKASHEQRRLFFASAFREAVREGRDDWALLSKGYENWASERYTGLDEKFWTALKDLGESHGSTHPHDSLCQLLEAHTARRLADAALDERRLLDVDDPELKARAQRLIEESRRIYTALAENTETCPRVGAVSAHSLGNLEDLVFKLAAWNSKLSENERAALCDTAEPHYVRSNVIAEAEGFRYAPPYNRLALLEGERLALASDESKGKQHFQKVKRYARKAIKKSKGESGNSKEHCYAPPWVHMARALFRYSVLCGKPIPSKKISKLIARAVKCSPHDDPILADIDGFSAKLREEKVDEEDVQAYLRTRLASPILAAEDRLKRYFRRPGVKGSGPVGNEQAIGDELVVLRRWSSYSPLLSERSHDTVGGGYLLGWNGHRLAVDPGIGFLRNMHNLGYNACDIDAVIMTHQHVDHTADFEPLLSFFKMHGKTQGIKKRVRVLYSLSGKERWKKVLLRNRYAKEKGYVLGPARSGRGRRKNLRMSKKLHKDQIEVRAKPVFGHSDALDEARGRCPTGVGLVIRLKVRNPRTLTLGITSDTGYVSPEHKFISDYYQECDVVVIHVSTVKDLRRKLPRGESIRVAKERFRYDYEIGSPGVFYEKHLGFWGTAHLICDLIAGGKRSDRTILLSEFGEEFLGSRVALVEEIRRVVSRLGLEGKRQAKRVFIADVGCRIDLSGRSLLCQCGGGACTEDAVASYELETHAGDITMPHRTWSDRAVVHLCARHAEYTGNDKRGLWPLIGDFTHCRRVEDT